MAQSSKIVATHYNAARNFRILVFERNKGSFGYFFENLMDLSDEPVWPIPEVWIDDWPRNSGVYDTVELAIQQAQRDSLWIQHSQMA